MAIQCRKDQIAFEKMTTIENILGDYLLSLHFKVGMIKKDECTDAKWLGKLIIPGIGDRDCCSAIFPFQFSSMILVMITMTVVILMI